MERSGEWREARGDAFERVVGYRAAAVFGSVVVLVAGRIAGCGAAGTDEAVGEEEEVTFVGYLGEDAAVAVDELGVFVVWFSPGEGDFHVGGEGAGGFEVEDEVELAEDGFLVVEFVWGPGLGEGGMVEDGVDGSFWWWDFELDSVGLAEWLSSVDGAGFGDWYLD